MGQNHQKPPISSHGLFPAIVAIWFAALFGLGCLVLPAVLLERVADLSGIAKLVPAAAPPLGMTARIALASGAGVFGALLGFVVARRVAASQPYVAPARPAPNARRPISAKEELGADGFDASAEATAAPPFFSAIPGRKRSLAAAESAAPGAPGQLAPLPGQPAHWAEEHPLMPSAATIAGKAVARHAEGQSSFAAEPEMVGQPDIEQTDDIAANRKMAALHNQPPEIPAVARDDETQPADSPAAPSQGPVADPLRALLAGHAAPVDRLGGPLKQLGMVELAERLARSMRKREGGHKPPRSIAAELQRTLMPADPAPQATETAAAAKSPRFDPPPAAVATPLPAVPAALRPFTAALEEFDEAEDDDFAPSFGLPFARTAPAFTHEADPSDGEDRYDDDSDDEASSAYSSLLTMKHPSRAPAEFTGQEMPGEPAGFEPADAFAGQTPPPRPFDAPGERIAPARVRRDPAETERALRSALATLQRMSGTG